MNTTGPAFFGAALLAVAFATHSFAQSPPSKPAQAVASDEANTATVRSEPIVVTAKLDGVLEATKMSAIRVVPEEWSLWIVDRAVPHGTKVRAGEPIIWFDRKALERKIADLEAERGLTQLTLKQSEEELTLLDKSVPVDLAKVRRAKKLAEEDMKLFLKVEKPAKVRNSEFSVESAENFLAYEKEELRQLEKMYKADDLTEETEEIILRRGRDSVKRSEFSLLRAKEKHKETIEVTLPREEVEFRETLDAATLALAAAEVDLPLKLSKAKLAVEKLKYDFAKADRTMGRLVKDRDKLIIKSPVTGVVYYGQCDDGKWSTAATVAKTLRPGGTIMPHTVLLTVVEPRPLVVRAMVPAKELSKIRVGQRAKVTPTGFASDAFYATVRRVSAIENHAGALHCVLEPYDGAPGAKKKQPIAAALQPGMKCEVEVVVHASRRALVVPSKAVHSAGVWKDAHYVLRQGKDDHAEKVWVQLGREQGENVEILGPPRDRMRPGWEPILGEGKKLPWQGQRSLAKGDVVLLEKPKGK